MRPIMYALGLTLAAACAPSQPVEHPHRERPTPTPSRPTPERPAPVDPVTVEPGIGDPSAPAQFPAYAPVAAEAIARAVAGQNALAGALYAEVAADAKGNFALSPASIALAFGMTYGGARGETARQMAGALRYQLPQAEIHAAFGTILRGWNDDAGGKRPYELAVANRLFGEQSFEFRDPFLALTADHYQAEIERVDFIHAPESARLTINGWVNERTKERIPDILPEGSIRSITRLVLTNAVYFKGNWMQAFPEKATKDTPFAAPSAEVKVPMMHLQGDHRYAEKDGAKMLELRYEGDALAMQLVLPDDPKGLAALEERLAKGALDTLSQSLAGHEVIVSLPRFTISPAQSLSLKQILSDMGMTDAFDQTKADLSGMADLPPNTRLFIQDAFHKAFVEVQEKGTEAAAATAVVVGIETTAVEPPPPPPKVFNADHPFVFVIRDLKTNAILFMGRVTNPAER